MNEIGVNQGMSGDVSVRIGDDQFLITPIGIPHATMTSEQIVGMKLESLGDVSVGALGSASRLLRRNDAIWIWRLFACVNLWPTISPPIT
jgi:ribulose-5-phosphate 4-epimerase/fuculose-1-phosphate aldolase